MVYIGGEFFCKGYTSKGSSKGDENGTRAYTRMYEFYRVIINYDSNFDYNVKFDGLADGLRIPDSTEPCPSRDFLCKITYVGAGARRNTLMHPGVEYD